MTNIHSIVDKAKTVTDAVNRFISHVTVVEQLRDNNQLADNKAYADSSDIMLDAYYSVLRYVSDEVAYRALVALDLLDADWLPSEDKQKLKAYA